MNAKEAHENKIDIFKKGQQTFCMIRILMRLHISNKSILTLEGETRKLRAIFVLAEDSVSGLTTNTIAHKHL